MRLRLVPSNTKINFLANPNWQFGHQSLPFLFL